MSAAGTDYPLSLAGAHGRIAAYRAALGTAAVALTDAYLYVNGVAFDSRIAPWRRETARTTLDSIERARAAIESELAVTNP